MTERKEGSKKREGEREREGETSVVEQFGEESEGPAGTRAYDRNCRGAGGHACMGAGVSRER